MVGYNVNSIVLEVPIAERKLLVGLIADRVIEVISLRAEQIGPPPDTGSGQGPGFVRLTHSGS